MGNTNHPNNHNLNVALYQPKDFEQTQTISDPRYGKALVLKEKNTQQLFASIQRTLTEEKQWDTQLQEAFVRKQLNHNNIVKLQNYNSEKSTDFCSSFFKINLLYEFLDNNLKNEIIERQKVHLNYQEGELWYILDSLVNATFYLKTKGVSHGDIRPYNILLTKSGSVKLGDQFAATKKMTAATQIQLGISQDYYISPQHLATINKVSAGTPLDNSKGDVFSIAATVLEAATLDSFSENCVLKQEGIINWTQVNSLLQKTRNMCSEKLFLVLQKMLAESEVQRVSLEELIDELGKDDYIRFKKTANISIVELVNVSSKVQNLQTNNVTDFNISDEEMDRRIEAALRMSREAVARYQNSPIFTNSAKKADITTNVITSTYQVPEDDIVKRNKKSADEYNVYQPQQQQYYVSPTVTTYQPIVTTTSYQPVTDYQTFNYVQQQPLVQQTSVHQPDYSYTNANINTSYAPSYTTPVVNYPVVDQEIVKRSIKVQSNQQQNLNDYVPYVPVNTSVTNTTNTYVQPQDQQYSSSSYNNTGNNYLVGGNMGGYQEVRGNKQFEYQGGSTYINPEEFMNNNGGQGQQTYIVREVQQQYI